MEADDGDVLLTGSLLALDQTRGTVDTNNQTTRDLGIESTAVSRALAVENALHPGDHLVRGGIGGLVEVNATVAGNEQNEK